MHAYFEVARPVVIGHRGSAGTHPENTLVSFAAALEGGAQILESDVHVTRDGVPVLLHDPSLDRTTEGSGDASELDLADILKLDAAHRFVDEGGGAAFRGEGIRVPTLEEAFVRFPEARFNLEIKSEDPRLVAATLDLVERFDRGPRTLLAAGEDVVMNPLRAALAAHALSRGGRGPALGASLGEIVAAVRSAVSGTAMPEGVMALQVPPSFMGNPLVTRELVEHAHSHDVAVHVWTINDRAEIETLLELGVDGIVTDHPARMADWLGR